MTEAIIAIAIAAVFITLLVGSFWLHNQREQRDHEKLFFTETGKLPERSSMNVSATIFVYRHKETGEIKTQYNCDPEPGEDWTHIETLDPAIWIAAHYNESNGAHWWEQRGPCVTQT
jgi:hypothetical protein